MQDMDHQMSQEQSNGKKRHLSDVDPDTCEFTPLSKRINNLHLNGTNLSTSENQTGYHQSGPVQCECRHQPSTSNSVVQCSLCNPNLYGITRQALPLPDLVNIPHEMAMASHHHHHSKDGHNHQQNQVAYSPDMDVLSNPHYYTPNKLLFDLHIERVKRHGQLFKPNKYDG